MFRSEPHNKEIGTSTEGKTLIRRFPRRDANGNSDYNQLPYTSDNTKTNYHNMVREQPKQARTNTIACDLHVSQLGKYKRSTEVLLWDSHTKDQRQNIPTRQSIQLPHRPNRKAKPMNRTTPTKTTTRQLKLPRESKKQQKQKQRLHKMPAKRMHTRSDQHGVSRPI